MIVTINGERQYNYWLWSNDVSTWESALSTTWFDALLIESNTLMATPQPTINNTIDKRSTANFTLFDAGALKHFMSGQEVIICSSDGIILFGGYIDSCEDVMAGNVSTIKHNISCVDYHYLADKRIVSKAWQNTTIDIIVQYILDQYLEDEGVSIGFIKNLGNITQYIANYIPASTVLQDMADRSGCIWWIDEYKKLYFVNRDKYLANWNLIEDANYIVDDAIQGISVTHGNPEYRNKQYMVGTWVKTVEQTEISLGDGDTTSFLVGYKLAEEPDVYISLNGGAYTLASIGVKGLDTGHDWYWAKSDNTITQDTLGVRLTSVDKIKIVYTGLYQTVIVSTDYEEIASRKILEGIESSGIVESARTNSLINDVNAAVEEANAILDVYAMAGKKIEYTTMRGGLSAGTLQDIKLTNQNVDDSCLISSIDIRFENGIDYYNVSAFSGPIEDSWEDIFIRMSEAQKNASNSSEAGISDVILVVKTFIKTWTAIEDPNVWYLVYADGTVEPDTANFPCFDVDDRIKYISLYKNGDELFRIYRTAQTISATSILTTFIISSGSANFEVDQVKLVGGDSATIEFGTGIVVETHEFIYIKNNLESLQLQFTSNKWV